jgi:hypothetical protein
MAPRNMQTNASNGTLAIDQTKNKKIEDKPLTDFNWKKTMIQSRIMEKVHTVGDRIHSQTWLEQIRVLATERPISLASVLLMAIICVCIVPVVIFLTLALTSFAVTFFSFIFFEGTLLTIGTVFLGGLLVLVACVAFPFVVVLGATFFFASSAFNLCSSTGSRIKQMTTGKRSESQRLANNEIVSKKMNNHDGSAFLPACILDSDAAMSMHRAK